MAMLEVIDVNGDGKTDIKKGEQYREHYANVIFRLEPYPP
jgi:hypothetical protein